MTIRTFTEKFQKWHEALPQRWGKLSDLTDDPRYAPLVEQVRDMVDGLLKFYGTRLYELGAGHYFTLDQFRRHGRVPEQWTEPVTMVCFFHSLLHIGVEQGSDVPDELDMVTTTQLLAALKRRCRRYLFIAQLKEDEDNILSYYRYPHGVQASLMAMRVIDWEAEPGTVILRSESEDSDGEDWKS